MNCREDESQLSAWVDGELSPDEARKVEAHLSLCPACRDLATDLRKLGSLVTSDVDPDPSFVVRFRARRDELSFAPGWTWRQLALTLLPLAAVVLVAALLSLRSTGEGRDDLHALELAALDSPPSLALLDAGEPVLSIALAPFPTNVTERR